MKLPPDFPKELRGAVPEIVQAVMGAVADRVQAIQREDQRTLEAINSALSVVLDFMRGGNPEGAQRAVAGLRRTLRRAVLAKKESIVSVRRELADLVEETASLREEE